MFRVPANLSFLATENVSNSSTASVVFTGGLVVQQDSLINGNISIGNILSASNAINNLSTTSLISSMSTITNLVIPNTLIITNLSPSLFSVANTYITNATISNLNSMNFTTSSILFTSQTGSQATNMTCSNINSTGLRTLFSSGGGTTVQFYTLVSPTRGFINLYGKFSGNNSAYALGWFEWTSGITNPTATLILNNGNGITGLSVVSTGGNNVLQGTFNHSDGLTAFITLM